MEQERSFSFDLSRATRELSALQPQEADLLGSQLSSGNVGLRVIVNNSQDASTRQSCLQLLAQWLLTPSLTENIAKVFRPIVPELAQRYIVYFLF